MTYYFSQYLTFSEKKKKPSGVFLICPLESSLFEDTHVLDLGQRSWTYSDFGSTWQIFVGRLNEMTDEWKSHGLTILTFKIIRVTCMRDTDSSLRDIKQIKGKYSHHSTQLTFKSNKMHVCLELILQVHLKKGFQEAVWVNRQLIGIEEYFLN